jgi:hypothetical protein
MDSYLDFYISVPIKVCRSAPLTQEEAAKPLLAAKAWHGGVGLLRTAVGPSRPISGGHS